MPDIIISIIFNVMIFAAIILMFYRKKKNIPRNHCFQCKNVVRQVLLNGDGYWSCNGSTIVIESLEPVGKNCFRRG